MSAKPPRWVVVFWAIGTVSSYVFTAWRPGDPLFPLWLQALFLAGNTAFLTLAIHRRVVSSRDSRTR